MRAAVLLLLTQLVFGGFAMAQTQSQPNTLLATRIDRSAVAQHAAFRQVTSEAINALQLYQVSPIRPNLDWSDAADREALLASGASAGLAVVVTAELIFPRRRTAQVNVSFINARGGDTIANRSLDFRYDTYDGLIAQIEYELERDLKRQFRQLGQVVSTEGGRVFFDLGLSANIQPGEVFRVYQRGAEVTTSTGESYGYLDDQTGVIVVTEVTNIYAIAEVMLGQRSIRSGHWVERLPGTAADYRGEVLSKLENQVAINLGARSGVSEGAEFAVYKDLKPINDDNSFRVEVGRIRITEVRDAYARGIIARSNHYELANGIIQEGDVIEEVPRSGSVQLTVGRLSTGIIGDAQSSVYNAGLRIESPSNLDIFYRLSGGYGDTYYAAVGAMVAINHSESFFYGIDGVWNESWGTNLFMSVNVPTPFQRYVQLYTEVGYLIGTNVDLNGLNINLGLNLSL